MATYYVRPAGAHGNTPDGLTYETAWLGISTINWTTLRSDVNTLYVCGTHGFWQILSKPDNGNLTTIRGDYPGDAGSIVNSVNCIQIRQTNDLYFMSLTVQAGTGYNFYIYFDSNDITVDDCDISGGSYGLLITTNSATAAMSGYTIKDCVIHDTVSNKGIDVYCEDGVAQDISDITISGCTVHDIYDRGIEIRGNGTNATAHTVVIENTEVYNCGLDSGAGGRAGILISCKVDVLTTTPEATKPYNVLVDNCTLYQNGYVGISFQGCTNVGGSCILRNSLIYDNCFTDLGTGNVENIGCKGLIAEDNIIHTHVKDTQFDGVGLWIDLTFLSAAALAATECIYQRNRIYNHTFDTSFAAWDTAEFNGPIGAPGINILGGTNNQIISNIIYGNTTGIALRVHDNSSQTPSGNIIANNTIYNSGVVGIALVDINDTTNEIKNNIIYGGEYGLLDTSAWADEEWGGANGYATKTINNNNFFGQSIGAIAGATGITNTDPVTTDPQLDSNYNLSTTSPCLAAGVKWWTGPNKEGYDGEPFGDFDTDIGGIQSKHSPFHPTNL